MTGNPANLLRRLAAGILACLALGLLSSCASFGGREITIPLSRLQENLERRFPLNNRVLDMFDIQLAAPRISTLPEENRLQAHFAAVVLPPFTSKSWRGSFTMSGGLRVDPARNAVFIRDAKVEDFSVDNTDPAYRRQISKLGSLLLERFVQDIPLYTFTPEQLKRIGGDVAGLKINTRQDALVVSFEPTK